MICKKCGAETTPGRAYCGSCGARVEVSEPKKAKKASPIPAVLAVLVVAVVAVLVVALSGLDFTPFGHQPDALAQEYMECLYGGDRADILELQHEAVVEAYLKDAGMTKYEYRNVLTSESERLGGLYERSCGKDWKMSYTVKDQWNSTGDALDEFKKEFDKEYNLDVDAVKNMEMDVTISGSKGEKKLTMTVVMVKVEMRWYIV